MITLAQITEFLGWASIINMGFLFVATLSLILMREFVATTHSQLFNIDKEQLPAIYFNYLANYKTLSLIFCLVPYISLKIMSQ
ncbi:MAG: hypothetical protein HRU20_27540 [Pseudomonadales bacterium]|nr:hypothetical protein [Pseudomonadales bacterium]